MGEMSRESLKAQTPGRRKARALPGVPCWSSWRDRQHTGTEGWIPRPSRPGSWAGCGHNAPLAYLSQLSHIACIANCPWSGHAGEGPPRQPLCTPGPMSWAGLPSWGASRGACETGISQASGRREYLGGAAHHLRHHAGPYPELVHLEATKATRDDARGCCRTRGCRTCPASPKCHLVTPRSRRGWQCQARRSPSTGRSSASSC